jgi:hypothetical protein
VYRQLHAAIYARERHAGYDGAKRRKGSKIHIAVDTLDHLLGLLVPPAAQGERAQVEALAQDMQQIGRDGVFRSGRSCQKPAAEPAANGLIIELQTGVGDGDSSDQ